MMVSLVSVGKVGDGRADVGLEPDMFNGWVCEREREIT